MDPTSPAPAGILLVTTALLSLLAVVAYVQPWRGRSKTLPLPPGPKPLPLIGNLFEMPQLHPWLRFREHALRYGGITSYEVLGRRVIVLNSVQAAFDLLEKRSANYSDRPHTPITGLIGWGWNFALLDYAPSWRRHRRLFCHHFQPGVISSYDNVQNHESIRFLQRLLDEPSHFEDHAHHVFTGVLLRTLYGIDISKADTDKTIEEIVNVVETVMEAFRATSVPGNFLVEFLPFLRYVPAWIPSAGFQTQLAIWREASAKMVALPYERAKAELDISGSSSTLVGAALLDDVKVDGILAEEREFVIKNVASTAYAGGVDTTVVTLRTFLLAMNLYPEAQKKAQAELDAVIGPNRLPDQSDRAKLPYVNALIKECYRWLNVAPLGLPHANARDDQYDGYFIPAGATVLPNIWAMLHDPEEYPEPHSFLPERFLNADGSVNESVRDPATIAFGFGRRICPGQYFAERTLFPTIARVLHTFDISPPLDEHGRPIVIEPQMKNSLLSGPVDCRCTIKPRSSRSEALVREISFELISAQRSHT